MTTKSIRIKKEFTCESHTIRLSTGVERSFQRGKWYETADPEVIKTCEETRTHFENPKSPLLFDVLSPEEARELHKAENEKLEPTATPDDPISLDGKSRPNRQAAAAATAQKALEKLADQAQRDRTDAVAALKAAEEARDLALAASDEAKGLLDQMKALADQAQRDRAAEPPAPKVAEPASAEEPKPGEDPKTKAAKKS